MHLGTATCKHRGATLWVIMEIEEVHPDGVPDIVATFECVDAAEAFTEAAEYGYRVGERLQENQADQEETTAYANGVIDGVNQFWLATKHHSIISAWHDGFSHGVSRGQA